MVLYIAGDIGGTNSRLQLIEWDDTTTAEFGESHTKPIEQIIAEETYPSGKYVTLTSVVRKFLQDHNTREDEHPQAACFAVAGPVRGNKCHFTNLNWVIDGDEMGRDLNIPTVQIVNDFVGLGYGLLALTRDDIVPINDVAVNETGPKAVLGAGTGLGEAYLTYNGEEYDVWGCEGGHTDFPPRNQPEFELMKWILNADRVDRVSVERLVSGKGIPRIFDYFASTYPNEVDAQTAERVKHEDKGAVIAESAKSGVCAVSARAIDTFVQLYGAEAGNLALKTLPFGGLYVAGGIAPKLLWALLKNNQFYSNFVAKGRMQKILEQIPVFVVVHPQVGLLGAQVVCRRILKKGGALKSGSDNIYSENRPVGSLNVAMLSPDIQTAVYELQAAKKAGRSASNRSLVSLQSTQHPGFSNVLSPDHRHTMRPETPATSPTRKRKVKRASFEDSPSPIASTMQLIGLGVLSGLVSTTSIVIGYMFVKSISKQQRQQQLPSASNYR